MSSSRGPDDTESDHRQLIESLRASEARYRRVVEANGDLIVETSADGQTTFVSPQVEDLVGYTPEEIRKLGPFALIHEADRERVMQGFDTTVSSGATIRIEAFRVRHKDGHWVWLESTGVAYRLHDGEQCLLSATRDVTARREADLQRREMERRIEQAQKLESLGVMAGGIAHDFNNLLTPILGDASLALMDMEPDHPVRDRIERIQVAARRAAMLTRQMLDYAGAQSLEVARLSLSELVGKMQRLLEGTISGAAELRFELAPEVPALEGDPSQLSQVVVKLVQNAIEAMGEGGGCITVRTGARPLESAGTGHGAVRVGAEPQPGPGAFLEVEDTGCGMDEDTRARMFDPFFTTKFTGRGLGLASVVGIVRSHQGTLEVESSPGRGTRICALFPQVEPAAR